MNITAVESSTLAAIAYDDAHEILPLEFHSRAIYRYFEVPAPVYEGLLLAPSKGRFFNRAIRGSFPYSRVCTPGPVYGVKTDGAHSSIFARRQSYYRLRQFGSGSESLSAG